MNERSDAMLAELKRAGLKLTAQRRAIVRLFANDRSHPTAQDLYERLRPEFPTMSFATVYNTLDALARCGLTGQLRLGSAVRYDPNTATHHHAVCDVCGTIVDLPAAPPPEGEALRVLETSGFSVRAEERTYRGICSRCTDS